MKIENHITVHKLAADAYGTFVNPKYLSKWLTGFKRFELFSGDAGVPGARGKLTIEEHGKEVVLTEELVVNKPNKEFTARYYHDDMVMHISYRFIDSRGEASKIVAHSDIFFKRFSHRLTAIFVAFALKKRMQKDLVKLKNLIEKIDEENTKGSQ